MMGKVAPTANQKGSAMSAMSPSSMKIAQKILRSTYPSVVGKRAGDYGGRLQ